MKRKPLKILSALLSVALSFLWIGCASEPLALTGNPVKIFKSDSLTLTAIFLDEMTLKKRYGKKNNPFINVRHVITPRTFMVFDLIIKAESEELKLQLNKMELEYAALKVTPMNRFILGEHWVVEDDYDDNARPIDTQRKKIRINKTLFPDRFDVSPGSTIKGLVVFSANFPKSGTATLTIPFFDNSGNVVDVAELNYKYSLY